MYLTLTWILVSEFNLLLLSMIFLIWQLFKRCPMGLPHYLQTLMKAHYSSDVDACFVKKSSFHNSITRLLINVFDTYLNTCLWIWSVIATWNFSSSNLSNIVLWVCPTNYRPLESTPLIRSWCLFRKEIIIS